MRSIDLEQHQVDKLVAATMSSKRISGHTHTYYRYPARFSPEFINTIIDLFSKPGDLIIDPFVGGGTSLVEARALGRQSLGIDLNSLATFIAKTKTTILNDHDVKIVNQWKNNIHKYLSLNYILDYNCNSDHYLKNIKTFMKNLQYYIEQ